MGGRECKLPVAACMSVTARAVLRHCWLTLSLPPPLPRAPPHSKKQRKRGTGAKVKAVRRTNKVVAAQKKKN